MSLPKTLVVRPPRQPGIADVQDFLTKIKHCLGKYSSRNMYAQKL